MTDNEKRLREFVDETAPKLREAFQEAIRRASPMNDPETKERMESVIELVGPSPTYEQVELTRELVELVKGKGADTKRKKGKPTPAEVYAQTLYKHGVALWRAKNSKCERKPKEFEIHRELVKAHEKAKLHPDCDSIFDPKRGLPSQQTLMGAARSYRRKASKITTPE